MAEAQPEWFRSWADEVAGGQKLEEARLSLIAAPLTVEGDLKSAYPLHIAGRVNGSVKGEERVTVEQGGVVHGGVEAVDVYVAGRIEGDVKAKAVQLADGGVIAGDIVYATLVVEAGAVVEGRLKRG